jgi:GntR family transcriptional regulator
MLSMLAAATMTAYYASHTKVISVTRVVFEIDLHGKTPAYLQLAARIRDAIAAGLYGPRDPIPSLKQLAGETGLAMGTVQRAIKVLEDEGLVYTVSGRGTFVSPQA